MKYRILMLKDTAPAHKRFMPYDNVKLFGGINGDDYECVYQGEIEEGDTVQETLDRIFAQLNAFHPTDYNHRSLSVSDIIMLPGCNAIWYVDRIGFRKIF